ncbi:MAG: hypothetical protein Q7T86_07205 [Hyphomicrobiaceae bacterium]|nr:hypothetical protein [Hyphomicrobiaceae bacterium]
MATSPDKNDKNSSDLKYGEGQREQYGEGYGNRPEDVNEGADASTDGGWAGGDREKTAQTDEAPGGNPDKNKPKP